MNSLYIRLDSDQGKLIEQLMIDRDCSAQKVGAHILRTFFNGKPSKPPASKKEIVNSDDFNLGLSHLKAVTGRNFKVSTDLKARLKDYTLDDVKQVIEYKAKEWMGGSMQKYLRPETLFSKTKFEGYLNDSQQLVSTEPQHENRPQTNVIDNNQLGWSNSGAS